MERLKQRRLFISSIVVTALLLVGAIVYDLLRDDDPYKYFTGMGNEFDISPDDQHFLFSYYVDGKEGIYRANADGTDVKKLTSSETELHHAPKYASDGTKILFLSQNAEGVNSLVVADQDGNQQKQVTPKNVHVSEAVFSTTGETVYYIGVAAETVNKTGEDIVEGLYSVNSNGENRKQLTTKVTSFMNSLSVTPDGNGIYYRLYDGQKERIFLFSFENNEEKEAAISEVLPQNSANYQLSPNEDQLAYTTISEESQDKPHYEYELFLIDVEERQPKRLTNLQSSVVSPRFLHHKKQIAFLDNTSWPIQPFEHELYVLDLETEDLRPVELALSTQVSGLWFIKSINALVNGYTIALLYIVLIGLLITYLHQYYGKIKSYVPAIASLILTAIVIISSILVTVMVNPWYGIGLGMLAAALLGCTLLVFGYAFILNFVSKKY